MLMAIGVGLWAALITVLFSEALRTLTSLGGLEELLEGHWAIAPALLGVAATAVFAMARSALKASSEIMQRRQAMADLVEGYHLGIFQPHPAFWVIRAGISLLGAAIGGILGFEGGVMELGYAGVALFSRNAKLLIEERQVLTLCLISATLSAVFSAPFGAALVALEMTYALEAKTRSGAILAALTTHGLLMAWSMLHPATLAPSALGVMFSGARALSLEPTQWATIFGAAALVGMLVVLVCWSTQRALSFVNQWLNQVLGAYAVLAFAVAGLAIAAAIASMPGYFIPARQLWEDLAWSRLSTGRALTVLALNWTIFIFAFAGFGSLGIFTPLLILGGLVGSAVGGGLGSYFGLQAMGLPLSIAGAVCALAVSFQAPVAAAALVLEAGHDGSIWWVAVASIAIAQAAVRVFGFRPLHVLLLERRGMRLVAGRAVNLLTALKTHEAMHTDFESISDDADLGELRRAIERSKHHYLGVLSMDGKFLGILAFDQLPYRLRRALSANASEEEIQAVGRGIEIRDLLDSYTPTIAPEESLEAALSHLQDVPCVAVVDEDRRLRGLLFESSIVGRYRHEVASRVFSRE